MPARVILHIGHPKTGSSAFQAYLAQNHDSLKKAGVLYPEHSSFEAAKRNKITSGNVTLKASDEHWLERRILPIMEAHPGYSSYIFSNENLIHRMDSFLRSASSTGTASNFHVLLAVRNPLEQLSSVYQQMVKRHGYTKTYDHFLSEHNYRCNALLRASSVTQALDEAEISYTLRNYSFLRRRLFEEFTRAIGINQIMTEPPAKSPVNRSLSATELQLLLFVNAIHGKSAGQKLSDQLVNQLPKIQPVTLRMSATSLEKVEATNRSALISLNARLPNDTPLTMSCPEGMSEPFHCGLSAAQLEICRQALSTGSTRIDAHQKQLAAQRWNVTKRLLNTISRLLA